jgi:hypothetical protein
MLSRVHWRTIAHVFVGVYFFLFFCDELGEQDREIRRKALSFLQGSNRGDYTSHGKKVLGVGVSLLSACLGDASS